ncbi:MAG: hypothetical protein AMJ54_14600 [Deltaproteobacteria bacterium SG8_13]|nr:MAG: hypothetical protein AMJ54_14600 [Deltaproteobacteria bacterium SG8_13]
MKQRFSEISPCSQFLIFLLAVTISASVATAYVLHPLHLLELMTSEMGQAESLMVYQKLVVNESELPEQTITLQETVMYIFPDAFRSEITSNIAQRIHVVDRGRSATIIDAKLVADREGDFDRYKDLFLYNSRDLLDARLRQIGVETSISSLGKHQGRIGYVIGAQFPDELAPQLWLDKNTFKPFRWLLRPGADGDPSGALEVRYYGWRQFEKIWYPEFYQGENLLRTILVQDVKVNPRLDGQLFDVRRLRAQYPRGGAQLPARPDSGGQSDVQETVERFQRLFE